jgi:two-component system cell cycle sensor histidine kinase/response regulator CckA
MKKELKVSDDKDNLRFLAKEKEISDLIINHSRSMISVINRNYIYEKVNTTFCDAHLVAMDYIVGKSLVDVWGTETFQNIIKNNIDLCLSGQPVRYEALFNTPLYDKRYFEVVFSPLSLKKGEITHLLAETFEIDDLKRSKQAVIEKEEEFRKIETNLPIGFLRCDLEGKILHANKAFLSTLNCNDESSITKMNLKSFYQDVGMFEIHVNQLLDLKIKTFGRVSFKNCLGIEIPCRLSGFLTVSDSGSPLYIDFAVEDSSRELMLENRLLQAQKLETIGALAGGIAHDFNNILTTISGYSEMLQEDLPKNSPSSEKVSKIQGAVLRAQSITNQILTFSRQVEQEKILVSASEILRETIGFVRSATPSYIIIKSHIPKKEANVLADPTQLFRVFLNLMTNAIQSMDENGGTLSVNLTIIEGKLIRHELNKDIVADEYVLITFRDTGKGMEPSLMRRIFEPFFTTREVGKGTGLGLSVVHGIISELDGEILISSKKQKGSVFYVYLPVSMEYADISSIKTNRKKILFIKGNEYESRIFSLALERTGYELIYVSGQKHLIAVMSDVEKRPDLVIYMSDSKQIKNDDLLAIFNNLQINTPCILITDPNQELLEEKLLNSGIIKQHLIKPVSLKEISNAIQISFK